MAKKIVAVQDGLHDTAQKLRKAGYQVISTSKTNQSLDAIVYSTELSGEASFPHPIQMEDEVSAVDSDGMVMMLNADEFSIEELIDKIAGI